MEVRLLGPVEALEDGSTIALGGAKPRALLARLVLEAGHTVSRDRLIDDLWGEDAPETAAKMVQIYVSQLRKQLPPDVLRTSPAGYLIATTRDATDVAAFEALHTRGREALDDGDAAAAARLLREAEALWRGPALAGQSEPFADTERARLAELLLACTEDRIDAELAAGEQARLVSELEALVAEHPLRERLRAQHMLALYRSGRQAEALGSYRAHRRRVDDELGIEPSPALRDLEVRILRQDRGLDAPDHARATRNGAAPAAVRYARSGEVSIAYQVVGDGPRDLVLVNGWVCSFQPGWERPQMASFYRGLAKLGRLILFDKRGTGLSDRVHGVTPIEERMDDVRAVMDAAGSERAVVLGVSEGGPMVSLFAAAAPDRVSALVAMGTFARRIASDDYPIDIPHRPIPAEEWGSLPAARAWLEERAPSVAEDDAAVAWYASYITRGASPAAAQALRQMNNEIDVRHVLPTISVPTLVLYRRDEFLAAATRYMGERIPGARVVALRGDEHLPWEGDREALLAEIERFLAEHDDAAAPDDVVTTVLQVAGEGVADAFGDELARFRGIAQPAGDALLRASFDGPARAVRCAASIVAGRDLRAGVHTGASGPAVEIAGAIAAAAPPGGVLVSSTVRDLVAGSGLTFAAAGAIALDAGGERREWALFTPQR
jgi:DNA-binding SARP family transcriptional activator/pimeloyl-ACP methyl ester carboxylesterase